MDLETRTVTSAVEMREVDGAPVLTGYAATFGQEYDLGAFREVIDPAAFNRTLGSSPDVRLLVDHEGQPLARTARVRTDGSFAAGTLSLVADEVGLRVQAALEPTDPDVQRLLPKMRRGDLDQMSFAFRVPAGGDTWSPDYSLRTLRTVELNGGDVSVVTYPANPATSVSVRSRDERAAKCVLIERVAREVRAGKTLSAATVSRLQDVLASLVEADAALDEAGDGLDVAQSQLADLLGVADPDPPGQANSGRPLGLALAVARRLGSAA